MSDYLSIGKVAKLKNVSIKSLRYYDEIGIFKPAYINTKTNYRYYTSSQLPLLDAISLCIEIGIPLKDFIKYQDKHGKVDLHRLLCDGKIMAEEKIKAMGRRLETLSHTIAELENSPAMPSFKTKSLPLRRILALPFDEATTTTHYSHLILSLFVGAQKLGFIASYPSGFLYHKTGSDIKKYVFLMLNPKISVSLPSDSPFSVFTLKEGIYYYEQSATHQIEDATQFFAPLFQDSENTQTETFFIETDLLSKNEVNKFELQLLKETP